MIFPEEFTLGGTSFQNLWFFINIKYYLFNKSVANSKKNILPLSMSELASPQKAMQTHQVMVAGSFFQHLHISNTSEEQPPFLYRQRESYGHFRKRWNISHETDDQDSGSHDPQVEVVAGTSFSLTFQSSGHRFHCQCSCSSESLYLFSAKIIFGPKQW